MQSGRVCLEQTLSGFLWAGLSSLDLFFHGPGAKRVSIMGDGEGRIASYCNSCGAFFVSPRNTPDPNYPKCGQCGIDLRPGRIDCHGCGWQPTSSDESTKSE
jgi:uncharacterized OB-fold protein